MQKHQVLASSNSTTYEYRCEHLEILLQSWKESKGDEIEVKYFENVVQPVSGYFHSDLSYIFTCGAIIEPKSTRKAISVLIAVLAIVLGSTQSVSDSTSAIKENFG